MAKTRKIPLRKSVVSGEIIDKRDLLRIVKTKDGEIFIDPTGKKNGRGAYIKLDNEEALKLKRNVLLTTVSPWMFLKVFMMNSLLMWITRSKKRVRS